MSGSGARDGFGSPPWEPARPVPHLDETKAIPGLGPAPAPPDGPQTRDWQAAQPPTTDWRAPDWATRDWSGGDPRTGGQDAGDWEARDGQTRDGQTRDRGGERVPGPGDAGERTPRPGRAGERTPSPGRGGPGGPGPGTPGRGAHRRRRRRRRSFWRELPVLIVVALALALLIKSFAIQAFFIPSSSMENTLEINDRVLINKIVYHLRPIHRGDVVVFDGTGSWDQASTRSASIFSKVADELEGIVGMSHDTSIYIKRVIGLPGDRVQCCNRAGQVVVNGVPLHESGYLYPGNQPSETRFGPLTVQPGRLWVMGDHREVSYDSRGHMGMPGGGTIPESAVLGRAFVIIWPPSRWGFLNIPATFEEPKLNASTGQGGNAAAGGSSAALAAALEQGIPVRPAASPLPLALGFIGAVPLTWLQRRARTRLRDRRTRRRDPGGQ